MPYILYVKYIFFYKNTMYLLQFYKRQNAQYYIWLLLFFFLFLPYNILIKTKAFYFFFDCFFLHLKVWKIVVSHRKVCYKKCEQRNGLSSLRILSISLLRLIIERYSVGYRLFTLTYTLLPFSAYASCFIINWILYSIITIVTFQHIF